MTLEDIGLGWLGVFGAIAAAVFSVYKVFSTSAQFGAQNQKILDTLDRLHAKNVEQDEKLDSLSRMILDMKEESAKSHADIRERLVRVETIVGKGAGK